MSLKKNSVAHTQKVRIKKGGEAGVLPRFAMKFENKFKRFFFFLFLLLVVVSFCNSFFFIINNSSFTITNGF